MHNSAGAGERGVAVDTNGDKPDDALRVEVISRLAVEVSF
ncbi:hypothetical protein HNR39_002348 [Glaciimonas immobilis]|uniref:Uncharacterized protein n=1 Tax=Glaciimonas immobilis TaxID=728004 RepID=A0A840RS66_9BURK|nr:hypothetical protein [Glaciimonas immobilis]